MIRSFQRPSRRAVLGGLAALGVPLAAPAAARQPGARLLSGPAALLGARSRVARVGRAYLRLVPEERDVDRLSALLAERLPEFAHWDERADPEPLRRAVARSVQDDFAAGRVARVQGWVLARTEARLAALVALG